MTALIFDTCCGCFELRTGCLIIGYLNLIYSIVSTIAMLMMGLAVGVAVNSQEYKEEINKHPEYSNAITGTISATIIIAVVITLLLLIFNIVFLVGVHQNKRGHVKAYMIFNIVFLVLYTIMFFAGFVPPINWASIVQGLFIICLSTYFLLVIRSFYYRINDTSRNQPAIYNTA